MTSPPLTTREYAYFHVRGPGTHEEVSKVLEMKPSEAWNAGDINPRNGKARKVMSWKLESGLDDTMALDAHINEIFSKLRTKSNLVRQLWLDFDLTLVCVGYFPPRGGHGMHFNREHIRHAAQLGMAFDLDFYYVDDHEHEL
ncbi:MAG: DUF4279 domain-containing protein [Pseudomonadota bacterium]